MRKRRAGVVRIPAAVVSVLLLFYSGFSRGDDGPEASRLFATQTQDCGLDHGYQCRDTVESNFLGLEADRAMVPALYLVAWQQALADFILIEDLSEEQKQLQHYKIGFSENDTQYVVHFQALLLPAMEQGKAAGITRGTFGRTARYWINKSTMAIEKRLFYK